MVIRIKRNKVSYYFGLKMAAFKIYTGCPKQCDWASIALKCANLVICS